MALLTRTLVGAVVLALNLGEAGAAIGRHQWHLPLTRATSSTVVSSGRRFTHIRGGATEEWVCKGDVCELKPKAAGAANDAVSRRKAKAKEKRGKGGAGVGKVGAAEGSPLSAAPGFLKVLQAYFKGGWPVAWRTLSAKPLSSTTITHRGRRDESRQRNGSAVAIAGPAPGRRGGCGGGAACERG